MLPEEEVAKHGDGAAGDVISADLAVVLGGDGTMLRALKTFLGTAVPVFGVNFGRVGFLASAGADELEAGVGRAFAGEFDVVELPALEASAGDGTWQAVNDVVVTSSTLGRMIELGWAIGGEDLGALPCDGLICSTPSGSTAYNLSNGGPVLVWGLEAMALTFVAPHSLHARPLVVPRGRELTVTNRTTGVAGDRAGRRARGVRAGSRRSGGGAPLGAEQHARNAPGGDVLHALPAHLRRRVKRHTIATFRHTLVRSRPVPSLTPTHPGARA